jgi:succinate dehydrogenase / fumarate reductase cytochrome b subunit
MEIGNAKAGVSISDFNFNSNFNDGKKELFHMASVKGPLSPHLSVYKWHITMILSILHRGTGVFLSLGLLFISYWLLTLASGPDAYQSLYLHVTNWYGQIILVGFIFSIYLHMCNGIRHLFWDTGYGFEIRTYNITAYLVFVVSAVLTILTWIIGGGTI